MVSWTFLYGCLVFPSCLAVNGASKFSSRQRRSPDDMTCKHDGLRVDTKSGSNCLCPTGYTGTSCEAEMEEPSISTLDDMNVQDGGVISCELNKICSFRLNVNLADFEEIISNNKTISISGTPANSGIKYVENSVANRNFINIRKLYILAIQTIVKSVDGGGGGITFNVLQNNISVDFVTYEVVFEDKPPTSASSFVDGVNVPSGSRLVCGDFCRLLMVTSPLPNSTCSQVDALCHSSWSFPTFKYGSKCYTEIAYQSHPCQKLCFNVRGTPSTLCYRRLPSNNGSASCGCDPLCSNATIEDVCCPQDRAINVCQKPKVGGLSTAMVTGISVGISLSALIAFIAVGMFLKSRSKLKNEIDAKADTPGDDGENKPQSKNDVRRSSRTLRAE